MAKYDLEDVAPRMLNNPAINVALPLGGAYLLLCALQSLQERYQWSYAGDDLTDNQWDSLQEDIALVTDRLMVDIGGGEMAPTGSISAFVCDPGSGWLICDGAVHDEIDYPDLYAVLPAWLVKDEDEFYTPNLEDRSIIGSDRL